MLCRNQDLETIFQGRMRSLASMLHFSASTGGNSQGFTKLSRWPQQAGFVVRPGEISAERRKRLVGGLKMRGVSQSDPLRGQALTSHQALMSVIVQFGIRHEAGPRSRPSQLDLPFFKEIVGVIMPTYIEWKPSLTVFVDEIDDQHKQLYTRMNAFLESVIQGEGKQEIERTLTFMVDYCVVHFLTEERYMEKFGYPAYATHKKAHEALTADVLEMQREVRQGLTRQHIISLINQVGTWVTNHIEKMDKRLGAYLGSVFTGAGSNDFPSKSCSCASTIRSTPSPEVIAEEKRNL